MGVDKMTSNARRFMVVAMALAVAACDIEEDPTTPLIEPPSESRVENEIGFLTDAPLQAEFGPGYSGQMLALATVDDVLPGGAQLAGTLDGIGIWGRGRYLNLMVNHEISGAARVSKMKIDTKTQTIVDHSYVIDGSEGYSRLCSAEWVDAGDGFPGRGYFFTGEETEDGLQLAIDAQGNVTELPHIGRYAHENQISVPGFRRNVVVLNFDDRGTSGSSPANDPDNGAESELYMYVARTSRGVLHGRGQLYVFASHEQPNVRGLTPGQQIRGYWIPVPDEVAQDSDALSAWVDEPEHQAFGFARLEDGFYDKRKGVRGAGAFFFDTGDGDLVTDGEPWDSWGSIYHLGWHDPRNPSGAVTLTMLDRSSGPASGWASPDNGDMNALGHIMLQEDRANGPWEREPRIWRLKLSGTSLSLGAPEHVVSIVNPDPEDDPTDVWGWESSGIVDVSEWAGTGAWIFDVQAHSIAAQSSPGDGGQLIAMQLKN